MHGKRIKNLLNVLPCFLARRGKILSRFVSKTQPNQTRQCPQYFENNIRQGIAEGYYRENLDIELLSFFHTVQIRNTFEMMMQSQLKFSLKRITDFFIDMIIRLVANEKGMKYIEENLTDKK